MNTSFRRVFDRDVATPRRFSAGIAGTVAGFVTVGAATSDRRIRAMCYGLASALTVGLQLRLILDGERDSRQEIRDLWGLSHAMTDGRPWPPPGGWALGADAIAWLLRELHSRNHHVVVELGPGTSSVILGSCGNDLELIGIEHDKRFVDSVAKQLSLHSLDTYRLESIGLKPRIHENRTVQWYDDSILDVVPEQIDVLIVDGPPNWTGGGNRSPAWHVLKHRMPNGSLLVVDDAHRRDERKMLERWLSEGDLSMLHDAGTFVALEVDRKASHK